MRTSAWKLGITLGSFVLGGASVALAYQGHGDSIAAARKAELGSTVSLVGTVSVASGTFDTGFAIQQGHAGIYIVDSVGGHYHVGEQISVRGTLISLHKQRAVQPTGISVVRRSSAPVRPERLARHRHGCEATEGKLLKLTGRIVGELVDDSPYGYKFNVDDGSGPTQIFLFPGANIDRAKLADGVKLSVICFSSRYDTLYECAPRSQADIVLQP